MWNGRERSRTQYRRIPPVGQPGSDIIAPGGVWVPGNVGGGGVPLPVLIASHPFTSSERLLDVLTAMGLTATFAWEDGDGGTPTEGPNLTTVGTPSSGQPTGLVDSLGNAITQETYDGSQYRYNATPISPATSVVVVATGCMPRVAAGSTRLFSTRSAAAPEGYDIYETVGGVGVAMYLSGSGSAVPAVVAAPRAGDFIIAIVANRTTNTLTSWVPSGNASAVIPAGTVTDAGIGLGALVDAILPWTGCIRALAYFTDETAADWTASTYARFVEIARRVSGIGPALGTAATITRATAAAWQAHLDRWVISSAAMPCAGDSKGLRLRPTRTNKCYNTINPGATTGWTATGGTHSVVSDAAALSTAKAGVWGPNVHKFVVDGSSRIIYGGAATGADNPAHSFSALLRGHAGGEEVDVGLRDASSGAWQNAGTATLTTAWQLFQFPGITPGEADRVFALKCDANDTIYFVGAQLEEGPTCSDLIPNWATAGGTQRNADDCVLGDAPEATGGSIELSVTPDGWSGAEAGTPGLLYLSGGGTAVLYVTDGTWQAAIDGTTVLDSGVAPADGVEQTIRLRWTLDGQMSIDVDGTRVSAAYDGTLQASGSWELLAGAQCTVRDVHLYDSGV